VHDDFKLPSACTKDVSSRLLNALSVFCTLETAKRESCLLLTEQPWRRGGCPLDDSIQAQRVGRPLTALALGRTKSPQVSLLRQGRRSPHRLAAPVLGQRGPLQPAAVEQGERGPLPQLTAQVPGKQASLWQSAFEWRGRRPTGCLPFK
jgi:hypothetical protein